MNVSYKSIQENQITMNYQKRPFIVDFFQEDINTFTSDVFIADIHFD